MTAVTVSRPRRFVERDWPAIAASITLEGRTFDIFMRSSQGPLTSRAEPFAVLALLPAMRLGVPLVVDGPVSSVLLEHMDRLQDILCCWFVGFHKVPITAESANDESPSAGGCACFYSGGVDSSYTVVKNLAKIDQLIFIHGFDIKLREQALRMNVASSLRQAATGFGKPLIEVETNLRDLLDIYVDWRSHSHGLALGAVALALSPQFRRVYISSTYSYKQLLPLGSHTLTDPLWSNERTEVIHEGAEANRWEKIAFFKDDPTVQQHLRVCWKHPDGVYNCCHCITCLRTMVCLHVLGRLDKFTSFNSALDLNEIAHTEMKPDQRIMTQDLVDFAERLQADPAVIRALEQAMTNLPAVQPDPQDYENAAGQFQSAEQRVAQLDEQLRRARKHVVALEGRVQRLETSRSWRALAPLRRAVHFVRAGRA